LKWRFGIGSRLEGHAFGLLRRQRDRCRWCGGQDGHRTKAVDRTRNSGGTVDETVTTVKQRRAIIVSVTMAGS
jgi:hypothetical protein